MVKGKNSRSHNRFGAILCKTSGAYLQQGEINLSRVRPGKSSSLWFSPAVMHKNNICTHKRPRTRDVSEERGKA